MTDVDFFTAHAQMRAARRAALQAALTGRGHQRLAEEGDEPRKPTSFDGGARISTPAPPETHDQTLTALFSSGAADVGRLLA